MPRFSFVAAVVAAALASASLATPAPARDAELLGAGPATTRVDCGPNMVLVGLVAQMGQAVARLTPQCVGTSGGLTWQTAPSGAATSIGNGVPSAITETLGCGLDSFVSSLAASVLAASPGIAMIAIRCRNGGSSAPAGAQTIILPEDANAAMTVAGVSQCNGDEVATGIAGSAGDAMTSIGLICTSVADLGKLSDAAASAAPASALPQVNVAALSSAAPAAAGGAMPEPTLVPLSPGSGQPSPMSPAALPAPAAGGPYIRDVPTFAPARHWRMTRGRSPRSISTGASPTCWNEPSARS